MASSSRRLSLDRACLRLRLAVAGRAPRASFPHPAGVRRLYQPHHQAEQKSPNSSSNNPRMHASAASRSSAVVAAASSASMEQKSKKFITTSVTAKTVEAMKTEIHEAVHGGADIVELSLDFLESLPQDEDIKQLINACPLPAIVTIRAAWEG